MPDDSGWGRSAKDFTSGVVAGVAQVLVGHPANTIKARLQMQPTPPMYEGMVDCLRQTVLQEGYLGLYRGMASPLVGVGFVNAVVFFCNEETKRLICDSRGYTNGAADMGLTDAFVAGGATGLSASFITNPVELPMVRLQVEKVLHPERATPGPIAV
jgi:solute carrier family 25 carnitine/acylcarnitine transporter 20/29